MPWQKIKVITTAQNAENISELLNTAGALAVSFEDAADQPIYEPLQETPLWKKTCVCGLFTESANLEKIKKNLQQQIDNKILFAVNSETIADKDWIKETQSNFPPQKFGERLWVIPSWTKVSEPNSVVVLLDPGLAFGTGTHQTTRLCLEWLEANVKNQERIIDYGCGSGILSVAAIKLGAKQVWAIDHDPQALEATCTNAKHNNISTKQLLTATPEQPPPWQADILIANILAQPLIKLAPTFAKLIKLNGKIVLSGILREQVESVIKSYEPLFEMLPPVFKEEWARLVGIRRFRTVIKNT